MPLNFRKSLVSVKFLSAILGPEMAAPIFIGASNFCVLSAGTLHVHKIPRFRGVFWVWGGSADFIFMGAGIFLRIARYFVWCSPSGFGAL